MPTPATNLTLLSTDYGITLQFPGGTYPRSFPKGMWQIIPSDDGTTVSIYAVNNMSNQILFNMPFGDVYDSDGVAYASMDDLLAFLVANLF